MENHKITVIGAGNVGATCAVLIAQQELVSEVVVLDIIQNFSEGKALDMWQTAPVINSDTRVIGTTNDYSKTAGSDIIIITSGLPRKPGMSRDDLIGTNAKIVKSVTENCMKYSPDAIIIMVANPLDVMSYCAYITANTITKKDRSKIFGMAGILDTARFRAFLAEALDVSVQDIQTLILGGHGDTMVALPRYTNVGGIPVTQLIDKAKLDAIIQRTVGGGGEIVKLLGTSAWYAPAAGVVQMVEAIVKDQKRILPVCALCQGEYGLNNIYMGVPVKLGKNGIEKIIEIELNAEERALVDKSAKAIKEVMDVLDKMDLFATVSAS